MSAARKRQTPRPSAYDQAIRLLSRRDHAAVELRRKLIQRQYTRAEIDEAIEQLIERKYLDDERTARIWAEQELRRSGQGRVKALNRMLEHGLSREHAEAALSEFWDSTLEREKAQSVLQRLTTSIPSHELESRKTQASLARKLATRGFDRELIRDLLRGLGGTESESL